MQEGTGIRSDAREDPCRRLTDVRWNKTAFARSEGQAGEPHDLGEHRSFSRVATGTGLTAAHGHAPSYVNARAAPLFTPTGFAGFPSVIAAPAKS